jgi:ABC-2 type transport system permease protein
VAGISSVAREQLRAIAVLRWQLSLNSLRSVRGRLNLVSRAFAGLLVIGAGIGGAIAIGAAAWGITAEHKPLWLALPFWLISIFWQLFPVMASAFTQNVDTSALLRYPMSYPTYFLVRLAYGALDIATSLGVCWSLGLFVGICVADIGLLPWALLGVGGMVIFNLLLARMIFVWIEHWLSLRRSREVISLVFVLLMVCFQLAGPMLGRYSRLPAMQRFHVLARFIPLQRVLPPGLAAAVIEDAGQGRVSASVLSLLAFAGYTAAILLPLHLRLRQQYAGEIASSSGEGRPAVAPQSDGAMRRGWKLPFASGPVSAIFEKELHYFLRSGPMLFTMIMPGVMIIILWGGRKGFLNHQSGFLFPIGAAYCLLVMNNILYNSFGGDGGGIQLFLVSPISFRKIMAAKNLAQLVVLVAELVVLWLGVSFIYQKPNLNSLGLTFAWYLLAAPLNFSAGNLLSIYSPKRIDYSTFGRQRASESAIFVSLAVQLAGMGLGALAIFIGYHYAHVWIATLVLLALGMPSLIVYFVLLARIDRIAMSRRETMATELCRVQAQ